jgi:hypothetical protein
MKKYPSKTVLKLQNIEAPYVEQKKKTMLHTFGLLKTAENVDRETSFESAFPCLEVSFESAFPLEVSFETAFPCGKTSEPELVEDTTLELLSTSCQKSLL